MLGVAGIGAEDAQAADEHRHFRAGQGQQLRPIDEGLLRHHELLLLAMEIVAEAVGPRLQRREGLDIGLRPATHPCVPA